ncbi:uncharacterized protein LOC116430976 isoform X2 [Nomia melanderi]|uniref:uncharacterized protein LOC116430976 isoform X2 n=1 Tax=Nomia melanderi TaxID=2448451 RepID=UPI001303FE90|nr:zinc finger protein 774-like isoform X2 [Nomia melanderi]
MAVPNKWENVCRLCSEERNEMLSIFGNEGVQRKVAQKLRACLPVVVYKTDPLPKQICQFCAARLDDVYEFREYCLSVYKSMHAKLLSYKDVESVQIYLDAIKNSPDPCQAHLWSEKARAPPPLVPLPASLPVENPSTPIDINQEHSNTCIESLPELPCEVEIKEVNADPILGTDEENIDSREEIQVNKEEKRTSILEQVLMGSLTMNDRKELNSKAKLSSKWWCAPCNSYYKTKESLMTHMQLHCPRKYTCRKCTACFELVEDLAKHEATSHLKVTLDFDKSLKDCDQCERQFVSWEMLKQHRLRDHLGEAIDIGTNTWCSLCNRFFPSIEAYQNHTQLHETSNYTPVKVSQIADQQVVTIIKAEEPPKEVRKEHFVEATKSLTCPTCGKVCTQQSALSNHMRTHEPKRHKCDICGRSFGLFIRLAAHRMSEHSQQPTMSPVMASVEQEEALNAEREAREAREARTRARSRTYSEMMEKRNVTNHDGPPSKRSTPNSLKNVARCGICLEWFSDHTTMLTHLQTHSDNYTCKNFTCHICKKSFKEKWQLFRHEMSHKRNESIPMYVCSVCKKSFVDKSAYKTHQKTHIVDKTYHCSKCNKIFFKEVTLLTHQCTTEAFYGKKGVSPKSLQRSTASLGTSKRFKCTKCNATFSSAQSKNSHMKTHTEGSHTAVQKDEVQVESEDEPMPKLSPETSLEYSVPIEPKVEINEESAPPPIKRTLIRTTGGYRCGVCQSPFVLRELAVAHLRSAHPLMPYQCPYCKKRFTTQYTFTHHIKADHPDEHEN